MALFVRQDDKRSELQQRVAAEMQERIRAKAAENPDGVDDSQYIKGTKTTSSLAWAWVLIGILVFAGLVWLIFTVTG
jgi:hypothetical protein